MEKRQMTIATQEMFIEKNIAIEKKAKRSDRLWRWERVRDAGYHAFTLSEYKDEDVKTQEDAVIMWSFGKYLTMTTTVHDSSA